MDTLGHIVGRSHEAMKMLIEKSKPQNRTNDKYHYYHFSQRTE
jgi:hypothetical protein